MANKIISNLTPKTSPAAADVLAIEDTEATKKIDYNALADAILNKITSKTYSVAGSTQTLISAIDALNSNLTSIAGWKSSGSFNDLKKSGLYMTGGLSDGPNVSGISTWAVLVMSSGATGVDGTTVKQMAFVQNGANIYTRQLIASTWSAWTSQPTRAEVDALNNSLNITTSTTDIDLNTILDNRRIYFSNVTPTNSPTTSKWIMLLSLAASAMNVQIVFDINMSVYYRMRTGSPLTWSAWKKVTTTNV